MSVRKAFSLNIASGEHISLSTEYLLKSTNHWNTHIVHSVAEVRAFLHFLYLISYLNTVYMHYIQSIGSTACPAVHLAQEFPCCFRSKTNTHHTLRYILWAVLGLFSVLCNSLLVFFCFYTSMGTVFMFYGPVSHYLTQSLWHLSAWVFLQDRCHLCPACRVVWEKQSKPLLFP